MKTKLSYSTILALLLTFVSCGKTENEGDIVAAFVGLDSNSMAELSVGKTYQGGIVAYIYKSGDSGYVEDEIHGIIAATNDFTTTYVWCTNYYDETEIYARSTQVGGGYDNTNTIVKAVGSGNYAAKACFDLALYGYSDWVLPSIDELKILYQQKDILKNFVPYSYWSSTESDNDGAKGINFKTGSVDSYYKDGKASVRPIRYF